MSKCKVQPILAEHFQEVEETRKTLSSKDAKPYKLSPRHNMYERKESKHMPSKRNTQKYQPCQKYNPLKAIGEIKIKS